MKKLCTLLLFLTSYVAVAQFPVRFRETLKPDTSLIFLLEDVEIGKAGQNQEWDFSKSNIIDTGYAVVSVLNQLTPGYDHLPNANLIFRLDSVLPSGEFTKDENIYFIKSEDSKSYLLGASFTNRVGTISTFTHIEPKLISINVVNIGDEISYKIKTKLAAAVPEEIETLETRGTGKWTLDAKGIAKFPNSNKMLVASRFVNMEEEFDTVKYKSEGKDKLYYVHAERMIYHISSDNSLDIISKTFVKSTISFPANSSPTQTFFDSIFVYERRTTLKELNSFVTGRDEEQIILNALTIFPVPSNGIVSFNSDQIEYVEIRDIRGALIERQKYYGTVFMPASNGLYFVKAILFNGTSKTFKVPKE